MDKIHAFAIFMTKQFGANQSFYLIADFISDQKVVVLRP